MLYFTEQQVRELATAPNVIREIRSAFANDFSATLSMPPRTSLSLFDGAVLLVMPCYHSRLNAAGVKIVTVSRSAGVNARYELVDPETGLCLARMEANYLTDLRTAATSAVATDILAKRDAETLGVFGTGRQAIAHITVLPQVRRFKRMLVCGSGRSDAKAFCRKMKSNVARAEIAIEDVDAERCVRESNVICTCTTSSMPLFDGQWLRPGTHLNLVGAFQPQSREVDDETIRRAKVYVDTYEGALAEAGDLLIPMAKGLFARDQIVADLHEVASGKKPGRVSRREEITLFKSVGCALEDLVTARLIYEKAQSQS